MQSSCMIEKNKNMDWREKLFGKVLVRCDSPGTQNGNFEIVSTLEALADCVEEGEGAVCGIYFSFANISDESDDFGVRLEELYKRVHPRLKVVQVVLWAHVGTPEGPVEREAGFRRSLTGKPWFAVPFHDVDTKVNLWINYDNSFSGNIDNIPYIAVDNFYDKTKKAYFLSHFHADHTGGLFGTEQGSKLRNSYRLKRRKVNIYMSEITAVIFEHTYRQDYDILRDRIKILKTGTAHELEINGIKPNNQSVKLEVTLVPVNHMPGAVMFLFKVPIKKDDGDNVDKSKPKAEFRTILYTGDFVITNDNLPEAYPSLHHDGRPIHIDEIYCDDTHRQKFEGKLMNLPSRSKVIREATLLIRKWLNMNSNNAVALYTFYNYAYEELFKAISRETGQRIALSDATRLDVYSKIFKDANVYTGEQSRIHVYLELNLGEDKQPNMNFMHIHAKFYNSPEALVRDSDGPNPVFTLNYPTHCSKTQLDKFVEHLNNKKQLKVIKYFAEDSMV